MKTKIISLLFLAVLLGCDFSTDHKDGGTLIDQDESTFAENAEIDNIKRRLQITSNPGTIGFILLLDELGHPILYTSVKGKITSSSKRLSEPDRLETFINSGVVRAAPGDDGAYGTSSDYIFFWTTAGQYIQWNGKYLYSTTPFRTQSQALVETLADPR